MFKYLSFFAMALVAMYGFDSYAVDNSLYDQVQYKEAMVRELKNEIAQIDSEMDRCQKTKKGWIAATVVGGVGVAATGAGMIAQGVKIKKDKDDKSDDKKDDKKDEGSDKK